MRVNPKPSGLMGLDTLGGFSTIFFNLSPADPGYVLPLQTV